MGLGLRGKLNKAKHEAETFIANKFRRPNLHRLATQERLGAIYTQPSDMFVPDRVMLYALVRGLRPERVLEIGVRWGGGARIIASALEDAGSGKAVGIDPEPQAFRVSKSELFGRYELLTGYSPQATPEAVKRLGGPVDLVLIDAMHTHDHVLADFRGVIPHLASGGHVLLHDAFHQGVDRAIGTVLSENPCFVDCGVLTRYPAIADAPVAYQGLRLIRAGTPDSQDLIRDAYARAGHPAPSFSDDLLNWDYHWNRIKSS